MYDTTGRSSRPTASPGADA